MHEVITWIYCGFVTTPDVAKSRACFAEYLNKIRALLDGHHAAGSCHPDILLVFKFAM
jgi:hypothetical protein